LAAVWAQPFESHSTQYPRAGVSLESSRRPGEFRVLDRNLRRD
jgi:hypothetical protein